VFLALELGQPFKTGHRHITHDLTDDRFTLVSQFNILHTGAGDFGHRPYIFYVLGPNLSHTAAIGIVNSAGAAGADGNKLGPSHSRTGD